MIRNERMTFSGILDSMTRSQAHALVLALGGIVQSTISKSTTVLVIGKKHTSLLRSIREA